MTALRPVGDFYATGQYPFICDSCGLSDLCMCDEDEAEEFARAIAQAKGVAERNANFRAGRGWVVTVKDHGDGRAELAA